MINLIINKDEKELNTKYSLINKVLEDFENKFIN